MRTKKGQERHAGLETEEQQEQQEVRNNRRGQGKRRMKEGGGDQSLVCGQTAGGWRLFTFYLLYSPHGELPSPELLTQRNMVKCFSTFGRFTHLKIHTSVPTHRPTHSQSVSQHVSVTHKTTHMNPHTLPTHTLTHTRPQRCHFL